MSRVLDLNPPRATDSEALEIVSPNVGIFSAACRVGDWLVPRGVVGNLSILGRRYPLRLTSETIGQVVSHAPNGPVEFGQVLVTFQPREGVSAPERKGERSPASDTALVFRAPSAGRIYLRPAPDSEPFVASGTVVREGDAVALLEVMKTFHRITFEGSGLPTAATVDAVLVEDGADVASGEPLFGLRPADIDP